MWMRKLMIASLLFFLISDAQGQQQRFVLLPASEAKTVADFYPKKGPEKIDGAWEATKSDLDGLEANLSHISELRGRGRTTGGYIKDPGKYFRQYTAVLQAGQKRIFINAFCESKPAPVWHDRIYIIMDGGSCVWHALYDPATGKFSGLEMNGVGCNAEQGTGSTRRQMGNLCVGFGDTDLNAGLRVETSDLLPKPLCRFGVADMSFEKRVTADGVCQFERRGLLVAAIDFQGFLVMGRGLFQLALIAKDVSNVAHGVGQNEGRVRAVVAQRAAYPDCFLIELESSVVVMQVALDLT
jgi:hypothetical protein